MYWQLVRWIALRRSLLSLVQVALILALSKAQLEKATAYQKLRCPQHGAPAVALLLSLALADTLLMVAWVAELDALASAQAAGLQAVALASTQAVAQAVILSARLVAMLHFALDALPAALQVAKGQA